jgi:hypothetical protein
MIEKLKAHEWKQTNFYTINEEALKATFRTLNCHIVRLATVSRGID